jgi:arylsulfatase A-like enzyme
MSKNMNVLFIMTDQQRADHLGCYGNPIVKTPNLDSLASEGMKFTNSFCTNPMCMPNRASLLTGVYSNIHGVRSNGINLPLDVPTITQTLQKRNYHTGAIGKLHLQFWGPPYRRKFKSAENWGDWMADEIGTNPVRENFPLPYYGFDEVEMVSGHGNFVTGHYLFDWLAEKAPRFIEPMKERFRVINNFQLLYCDTELTEDIYTTTYVKERTIAFLERQAKGDYGNKPFFLHCSFPDPHHPVCPPGKYKDMYNPDEIELPASFDDIKNIYNHPFLRHNIPLFRGSFLRESTHEEVRRFIALTYGSITMIDHAIGEILASLEKLGLDNTMVIFTSDHGDLMGDHGMLLKGPSPFIGVLRVPLIWKVPGLAKQGTTSDSLISAIDIPNTILNLLNIPERHHPPNMQGFDITPILKDPHKKVRDRCLIMEDEELGPKGPLFCRLHHLITEQYKLTLYEGIEEYGDFFDFKNDPHELNNLWNNEEYKDVKVDMLNKLIQENLKIQSRSPERVSGV